MTLSRTVWPEQFRSGREYSEAPPYFRTAPPRPARSHTSERRIEPVATLSGRVDVIVGIAVRIPMEAKN